mmetsp:Transcript_100526/g.239716  ORF Transcript_100526/g.239716 Transcript_100526/m.239716 type:complete len:289 (+) Transcript_100526:719-1585(+)
MPGWGLLPPSRKHHLHLKRSRCHSACRWCPRSEQWSQFRHVLSTPRIFRVETGFLCILVWRCTLTCNPPPLLPPPAHIRCSRCPSCRWHRHHGRLGSLRHPRQRRADTVSTAIPAKVQLRRCHLAASRLHTNLCTQFPDSPECSGIVTGMLPMTEPGLASKWRSMSPGCQWNCCPGTPGQRIHQRIGRARTSYRSSQEHQLMLECHQPMSKSHRLPSGTRCLCKQRFPHKAAGMLLRWHSRARRRAPSSGCPDCLSRPFRGKPARRHPPLPGRRQHPTRDSGARSAGR